MAYWSVITFVNALCHWLDGYSQLTTHETSCFTGSFLFRGRRISETYITRVLLCCTALFAVNSKNVHRMLLHPIGHSFILPLLTFQSARNSCKSILIFISLVKTCCNWMFCNFFIITQCDCLEKINDLLIYFKYSRRILFEATGGPHSCRTATAASRQWRWQCLQIFTNRHGLKLSTTFLFTFRCNKIHLIILCARSVKKYKIW